MDKEILSCKNPSEHGDKWLLTVRREKNETLPCFACCTLSLEDKQELGLRKRMILTFFRDLMESNAQILLHTVASDDQIVFHTTHVFLNLLSCNDERYLKLTVECLLLFLIHMKKESLSLSVMQRLTVEIEEDCNYAHSLPHIHFLGRLFQVCPELVGMGTCTNSKFLHILANGLSYPVEEVKNAALYLLLQIYQNSGKNVVVSKTLDSVLVKSLLRILKCGQNKDLLKYSLSLLQLFICKKITNFNILFESLPDEASFTDIIKKIILSNETKFQVCMVQCVCLLLKDLSFEKQIVLLLEANIPEILFDALSTKNELLLESILCCLLLFIECAETATKSRFLFGVGIIVEVCHSLLSAKNWKLFCTALNLLTSIVTNNDYLLTSSHLTFYYQSIQLTERAFKVQNPAAQYTVFKYFNEFLKNKDLPWALPSEQIFQSINLCLKSQKKIISTLTVSEHMKAKLRSSKSFSIEMKILLCSLDMISSGIRLFKQYNSCPVTVEKGYTCPNTKITDESSCPYDGKSSEHFMILYILAMDEMFIPCCLQLKSTNVGGITCYHLIQALVVIFEENEINSLIYQFSRKLIRAGFLKYLFDLKANKIPIDECDYEQVKRICNKGVKELLRCILKAENDTDAYLKLLESGLNDLNDSLEECVNVLSQKSDVIHTSNELWASPSQITILCLCYFSYLNEAFVISSKILIPHLIYFVTCNSDHLSSSTIILKHLIFLMAVCSYDCMNKNLKFQSGLMEANLIIWDLIPKLKSPLQVYTHHKYMLWWCFRNQTHNIFTSEVLLVWVKFCMDEKQNLRHYAMKTVVSFLCSCQNAQQTFVLLFNSSSSSNNEILIHFLKEAYDSEVSGETNQQKFLDLIVLIIYHLHPLIIKLFVMKNDSDKNSDKILSQDLDCLLWCYEQINSVEIDPKVLFHVSKFCFLVNSGMTDTLLACFKFLQFTLKREKHFERAWHVVTGDVNFSSFFYKCFTLHSQLEVEALHLLINLFSIQVNNNFKGNVCIQIFPKQVLKWLNSSNTQVLAYRLLSLFIKSDYQNRLLIFIPLEGEENTEQKQYMYYRLFSLYFQNAIISGNPLYLNDAAESFLKFLNIMSKIDQHLENHIMLQPWIKILMESRLEKLDFMTWKLLEKWLNFNKVNASLIGIIQQFANKLLSLPSLTDIEKICVNKLCTGVYARFLSKETRNALEQAKEVGFRSDTEDDMDLVTQVQNIVTNYVSTPSRHKKE